MTRLWINVELVERLLGRPVDWDKTSWTPEERSVPIKIKEDFPTSTATEGGNEGPLEVRKNRRQRRTEAAQARTRACGGSANRNKR